MIKIHGRKVLLLFVFSVLFQPLRSFPLIRDTMEFKTIFTKALELGKRYGVEKTLVLFDLDNTLLMMDADLGSDQWSDWQFSLLKQDNPLGRISTSVPHFLNQYNKIINHPKSTMSLLDTKTPDYIKQLQAKKFPMAIITSRNGSLLAPTSRELRRNKLNFASTALGDQGSPFTFPVPSTRELKNLYQFSDQQIQSLHLNKGTHRKLLYSNGVFLTSGMHKGAMLNLLTKKYGVDYKAVVFTDDKMRHVEEMHNALPTGIDYYGFHYTKGDPRVEEFHKSNKTKVIEAWQRFEKKPLPSISASKPSSNTRKSA